VTGLFLRIKRDGKWQAVDVAEMTDDELREEFNKAVTKQHLVRWIVTLAGWIRDNVAVEAP